MQRTYLSPMQDPGCSCRLCEFPQARLVVSEGLPVIFLTPPPFPTISPPSPQQDTPSTAQCLAWESESASIGHWMKAL